MRPRDIPPEQAIDSPFQFSDINSVALVFQFVSDRGRAALEELAPGCVAFFPLKWKLMPKGISVAAAYFLIDVLPRAQLIDWDQSPTVRRRRALDSRESRELKDRAILDLTVKFKPTTGETPPIWREADVDRPAVHFFSNKMHIFLRDDVWESLNARFPEQLVAKKFA
jgi:hypothetical protein